MTTRWPRIVPALLLLVAMTLAMYWPVAGYDFIELDDNLYVTRNPMVLRGLSTDGVLWAFTSVKHAANWHPVTWFSHMLDVTLFGPAPGYHHLVNVLFHALGTVLLFLVLWRMTGGVWRSFFVAALFSVHPLHVESVAWISERKDVLSTLLWFLTMAAYLWYVRRPGRGRLVPVVLFYALGLMAKPMLVTLPFVLLLLDYWPLARLREAPGGSRSRGPEGAGGPLLLRHLVREKSVLFALVAVSIVLTFLAQSGGGAVQSVLKYSLPVRLGNALAAYGVYLVKMAWPFDLALFYTFPDMRTLVWRSVLGGLFVLGFSLFAIRFRNRSPFLLVGWLWYLGVLVPVLGLVQVGEQSLADRYTYVPLVGVFILLVWGSSTFVRGHRHRLALPVAGSVLLAAMLLIGRAQVGYWRDGVTILSRSVGISPGSWLMNSNLGVALHKRGRQEEGRAYIAKGIRLKAAPGVPQGNARGKAGPR